MKIRLTDEQITNIKTAFETMQNKGDLLDLLNHVAWILHGSFTLALIAVKLINLDGEFVWTPGISVTNKKRITEKQLNFFSTSFEESPKKRKRYRQFYITKKNGTPREINAPVPKLLEIQQALNCILQTLYTVQERAFGFAPGKGIIDNAIGHVGKKFILNVDIKDFFPSIHFRRIKVMLERPPFNLSGEREPLAYLLANLCTENAVLPQGAPTSPILTNIVCQRLDKNLQELARQFKVYYSRYADDLSFSSNDFVFTKRFMNKLDVILKGERFRLNPEKTRVQGRAYRQEVTGLTVNEKLNVNRHYLRGYRTLLHIYKTKGSKAAKEYLFKRKANKPTLLEVAMRQNRKKTYIKNVIVGKYNFIMQVRGKDAIKHPFENEMKTALPPIIIHNQASKSYGLKNRPEIIPKAEADEQVIRFYKTILEGPKNIVAEDSVPYKHSGGNTESPFSELINKVLNEWENDKEDGFEKAMNLLKQQLNEQ